MAGRVVRNEEKGSMGLAEKLIASEEKMGSGAHSRLRCAVTVTCCFLHSCVLGYNYTFGNINPYVTSYLHNVTGETYIDYTDTMWLPQTLSIATCASMPLVGLLANRLPVKVYIAIGIIFNTASVFGTYWAVQTSFAWTVVMYGVLGGAAAAIIYPICLRLVVEWFPGRKGLMSGLILMGYGVGSFMWNTLTTWYINHDNMQPDLQVGEDVYYTQAAVLTKVPSCFLVLGTVFVTVQVLCTLLIFREPQRKTSKIIESAKETDQLIASRDLEAETAFNGEQSSKGTTCEPRPSPSHEAEKPEYPPQKVLKSRVFWTLWFMNVVTCVGTGFVIPLYKAYGQTFIADDHFLAVVASCSALSNALGRPLWGQLADRFGARMVSLTAQSVLAMLVVTFVTCEVTGQVTYFLWVCAMFFTMCGYFTMLPTMIFQLYGSYFFNINIGLYDMNAIVGSILPAVIAPGLKGAFGWHGVFFVGFGGVFLGVLLNMSLNLSCGNTIPQHMFKDLSLIRRS